LSSLSIFIRFTGCNLPGDDDYRQGDQGWRRRKEFWRLAKFSSE
jgi:hypothetical protein